MGLKCAVKYCKPGMLCGICEQEQINRFWSKEHGEMRIPELYPENLDTLKHIMARLDLFGNIEGVFEVEVRVRIDDLDTWAVIGYGESGDPCLLRFDAKET